LKSPVQEQESEERMASKVPTVKEVMENPACSYWLKASLDTAMNRDPLDAIADAEFLVAVLRKEYQPMLDAARNWALSKRGPVCNEPLCIDHEHMMDRHGIRYAGLSRG
jgi:hypothetical protein